MRTLEKNKQKLYYATYIGEIDEIDANGDYTGDKVLSYSDPVAVKMNISPNKEYRTVNAYGISDDATHILVTNDLSCPIDTKSIIWIGKNITEPHNFCVRRVSRSLNTIAYAVKEVEQS